jgi:hypothetical protein
MPTAVLSWLVRFAVVDQLAASAGISVTQSQVQQGLASIDSQAASAASSDGYSTGAALLIGVGIAPQMQTSLGRYQAEEIAYAEKVNGGKLPSTSAQDTAVPGREVAEHPDQPPVRPDGLLDLLGRGHLEHAVPARGRALARVHQGARPRVLSVCAGA